MADEKAQLEVAEKQNGIASSLEGSGVSSPAPEYDDLPDPDVGKTDEERAKLVRPCHPSTTTQY
jgi:hypothetical protein